MTTEDEQIALHAQIDLLVAAADAERDALRRTSRTTTVVSAALFLVIGAFLLVNYLELRAQWTEEKLAESFRAEIEVLQPEAVTQVQEMGQALAPIYMQASRDELTRLSPEIGRRVHHELDTLGDHLATSTQQRLATVTERLGTHAEEITLAAYPSLEAENERALLTQSFHEATTRSVQRAAQNFGTLFATDIVALEQQIRGFTTEIDPLPAVELDKHFIRLWLQLLDAEIAAK